MKPSQRLAIALDPALIASACALTADPWQAALLRSTERQVILCCTRQAGKSTVTALLAVWTALFKPGLILLVSPSQRQSGELFRKIKDYLRATGETAAEESALRLELANGARIVSLPGTGDTIRGYSKPQLVIVDEAAFVEDSLLAAVRPMLAVSRGRLVLLSTPFGQRGSFYEAWEHGGTDWQRFKITAHECPRIDSAWLESERRQLGDYFFRSEYLCEFLGTLDSVFRVEDVQRAFTTNVKPLFSLSGEGVLDDTQSIIKRGVTGLFSGA